MNEADPKEVTLRKIRLEEAEEIAGAIRESVDSFFPWLTWAHAHYSQKDALRWLEYEQRSEEIGHSQGYGVYDSDHRFCGMVSLFNIDETNGQANIGYWIRASRQREGWGTLAVRSMAEIAFDLFKLIRLEFVIVENNWPSRGLAEHVGAQLDGLFSERLIMESIPVKAAVYSLLASKFER